MPSTFLPWTSSFVVAVSHINIPMTSSRTERFPFPIHPASRRATDLIVSPLPPPADVCPFTALLPSPICVQSSLCLIHRTTPEQPVALSRLVPSLFLRAPSTPPRRYALLVQMCAARVAVGTVVPLLSLLRVFSFICAPTQTQQTDTDSRYTYGPTSMK
ncbi:hypothetical protein L226DRAFT_76517 [Lentinus tigrinus ALCF2SS1-7]|uniref:uncharacterized protein n=1 Tax=Lentinus tigrinus ALCF2SS1-7 TaxID=1328758 RepID=UPI00116604D3|nr:hypothetical protein L226DRAFT_76517 [Lentinus tigrinus ALCF2SS1-7]